MSLWSGIKSAFGFDGVGESALKIVDKIAGTDWTPKEKAQFVLDHATATKYQSPTRRIIAVVYLFIWSILVLSWVASSAYGHALNAPNSLKLAKDIYDFMGNNVNVYMNGILAFYFLIGVKR